MQEKFKSGNIIPAMIIHEHTFGMLPLRLFDNHSEEAGSLNDYRLKIKQVVNYKWANAHNFIMSVYGGTLFKFQLYKQINKQKGEGWWEIIFWDSSGNIALGEVTQKIEHEDTDTLSKEAAEQLCETFHLFIDGKLPCTGCHTIIDRREVAGRYFAGQYCSHCWETKYKAIEAKENYN